MGMKGHGHWSVHCMEVTGEVKYSSSIERAHLTGRGVFPSKGHSIIVELKKSGEKTYSFKDVQSLCIWRCKIYVCVFLLRKFAFFIR